MTKGENLMNFVKGAAIRENEQLKNSFFQLAMETFGISFEHWDALGYWNDTYCPYAFELNGEIIANISMNIGTMVIDGKAVQSIQIGTVMTKPIYRKKGLSGQLMDKVLEDVKHVDIVYLLANESVLKYYPKFGFEKRKQSVYLIHTKDLLLQPTEIKKLNLNDEQTRKFLYESVTHRMPVSTKIAMLQNESIVMFHAIGPYRECIYYAPKLQAIIIAKEYEEKVVIVDIISKYPFELMEVLQQLPIERPIIELGFTPSEVSAIILKYELVESGALFVKEQGNVSYPNHVLFPLSGEA